MAQQVADSSNTEIKKDTDYYILDVQLLQAKELRDADLGLLDKSDTYCICTVEGVSYQTKTLGNNLNPVWNERCSFLHYTLPNEIRFELWDSDEKFKDEGLGRAVHSLKEIFEANHTGFNGWLDITNKGKINVCIKGTHIRPEMMKEELNNVHTSNQKLKQEVESLQVAQASVNEKLDSTVKKNIELEQATNRLEKENTDLFEKYKKLEGLNAELNHHERVKVEELTNKIALLEKEREVLTQESTTRVNEERTKLEQVNLRVAELEQRLEVCIREMQEKAETMARIRMEKEEMVAKLEVELTREYSKTEALKNSMLELTLKLESIQTMNTELQTTIAESRSTNAELRSTNVESQSMIVKLQSTIVELEQQLKKSLEQISSLENATLKLKNIIDEQNGKVEQIQSESMRLREELESKQKILHGQESKCKALEQELRSYQIANNDKSNQNNEEIESLRECVRALTVANERLTQDKRQQEVEIKSLQKEVQQHRVAYHQSPTQTGRVDVMPLQSRTSNKALVGGIAVASTVLFVLMWRMNKRSVAIGTSAVMQ